MYGFFFSPPMNSDKELRSSKNLVHFSINTSSTQNIMYFFSPMRRVTETFHPSAAAPAPSAVRCFRLIPLAIISASPLPCLPTSVGGARMRGRRRRRPEGCRSGREPQWNPNFFFDSPLVSEAFPHSRPAGFLTLDTHPVDTH